MPTHRNLPQWVFDTILRVKLDVLNDHSPDTTHGVDEPLDVQLKKCTGHIKAAAIDAVTGKVDYGYLKNSELYRDYRALTAHLNSFTLETLVTHHQKLAFWLNLYNVLVIDGIIHYGIRKTVNEIPGFFRQTAYCVGGHRFCLDDIEHGILRANSGHPYIPGSQFGKADPRRKFILNQLDHRIHFALVCGALSCPPVNFFDEATIDAQLDVAAQHFLSEHVAIDARQHTIKLTRILQWFGEDFGAGAWMKFGLGDRMALLQTIKSYLADDNSRSLNDAASQNMKIQFEPYNWNLNHNAHKG